jgi:hypothetical protein
MSLFSDKIGLRCRPVLSCLPTATPGDHPAVG